MHDAVADWLLRLRRARPQMFTGGCVLECGSRNVNGSPRSLFQAAEYVGLDRQAGKGVDVVGLVHEWRGRPDGYFDVVISTEMLEHDPHWRASLRRMVELLRPGGVLILTCAGPMREPHSEDGAEQGGGYYENRSLGEVLVELLKWTTFRQILGAQWRRGEDVYLCLERDTADSR
jgi:SAM-dependent methyltransferase